MSREDIPLIARVLCIADVYDALTTDRSYRSAFTQDEALAIMEGEAGKMIDPRLFQVFKSVIIEGHPAESASQSLKYAGDEKAK